MPTTEGSRIQSFETECDESAAQAMRMLIRVIAARYVHRRRCRTVMPASCRCRSPKRRVYSLSGISCAVLVKASRPATSEVLMDTPSLSG
jgi:phosphoribosylpyrophosphate synthetase